VTSASFTAGRIQAYADVSSERIRVLPLPVHDSFFATVPRNLSAAPYALTMADLRTPDPRKRSLWLPAIASRLAGLGVELRVVGPVTSGEIDLPQGSLLGRVSDKELAELMAGAICFISPSQYEGQGLPPVEAMAAGTPVLAFRNSAVTETIGVDDFLIDEPGVGEESVIPGSVLKVMVERVQQFGQERSRYGEMARRRAEAFRPHAFFAGVEQLAKEVRLWSDA
jgi:glycosyltransferase involved in cell wall biosynthesis